MWNVNRYIKAVPKMVIRPAEVSPKYGWGLMLLGLSLIAWQPAAFAQTTQMIFSKNLGTDQAADWVELRLSPMKRTLTIDGEAFPSEGDVLELLRTPPEGNPQLVWTMFHEQSPLRAPTPRVADILVRPATGQWLLAWSPGDQDLMLAVIDPTQTAAPLEAEETLNSEDLDITTPPANLFSPGDLSLPEIRRIDLSLDEDRLQLDINRGQGGETALLWDPAANQWTVKSPWL